MPTTMRRSAFYNWTILLFVLPWTTSSSECGNCRFSVLTCASDVLLSNADYTSRVPIVPPDSLIESDSVCAVSSDDETDASELPMEEAIPPESFALVIEPATLGHRGARSLQLGIAACAVLIARTGSDAVRFAEVRVAPSWVYRVQSVWRRYTVRSFPVRVHAPPRFT